SRMPGVARTDAPAGLRPVVPEWQTRDHLSVMGGVTEAGKVYTLVRQEPLNGLHAVEFLSHLARAAGRRLLVVWDGSPIHRRAEVKDLAPAAGGRRWLEALAAHAARLDPLEGAVPRAQEPAAPR